MTDWTAREWVVVLTTKVPQDDDKYRTRVFGPYTGKQSKHINWHFRKHHSGEYWVHSIRIEDGASLLQLRESERAVGENHD